MILPFELFVLDPWPYLRQLEVLLETRTTKFTLRELKRQNVHRKMVADGIPRPIYKQYGWERPESGASEIHELEKRRKFAAELASSEGMNILNRICAEYEEKYLPGGIER